MKLKKIGFAAFTVLLIGITLMSCHSDRHDIDRYDWIRGDLDKKATFYTDKAGGIRSGFEINEGNIYFEDNRFSEIRDIKFAGNDEIRLDVWSNAMIDELWLHIAGTDIEIDFYNIEGANDFYDDDEITYFLEVIVEEIRQYGFATINVDAVAYRNRPNIQVDVRILSDLDIYVRR